MIPIEKNIIVVDNQGNEYEATYPKRARGLVKNGRARFVSENKICLACPPNIMEDKQMSEINNEVKETKYSLEYALEQIECIADDKEYLTDALEQLANLSPSTAGIAADSIAHIVDAREETNRQLIQFYQKMYEDCREEAPKKSEMIKSFEQLSEFLKNLNEAEYSEQTWNMIVNAATAQLTKGF